MQGFSVDVDSKTPAGNRPKNALVVCADANYLPYAIIAALSTDRATNDSELLFDTFILTDHEVAPALHAATQALFGSTVEYLNITKNISGLPLSNLDELERISDAMYGRLFAPRLLADTYQRIVYLDADTLCLGSIRPLLELNLEDHVMAWARDIGTPMWSDGGGIPGAEGSDGPYFNSGVLVIDTKAYADRGVLLRCLSYLRENRDSLRFPDQDALNVATQGDTVEIDPRWNEMEHKYYEDDWQLAKDAKIWHFAGPRKPWDESFWPGLRKNLYSGWMAVVQGAGVPM